MANSPHPSPRLYTQPVPGGTVGRTDQGVDISGPPGTKIFAIARERLVGIIPNWYAGQPFYWFKELGSNTYNYVAEQFSSNLKVGDTVDQGQEIGTIAGSGTGLELGFATASGETLARATTGYTEGEATDAGKRYRALVIQGGGKVRPGGDPTPTPGSSGGGSSGGSGGGNVPQLLSNYLSLRDAPRTAPPGTKNPWDWFRASFTDNWDKLAPPGGSGTSPPSSSPTPTDPSKGSPVGQFVATAYGPPWGGIEGGGTTATGVDLHNAPHDFIIAVDPSVIPLHSRVKLNPNPFNNPNIVFRAEDTGGAIKGNRIDFYDWRGRASQDMWGVRKVAVTILGG